MVEGKRDRTIKGMGRIKLWLCGREHNEKLEKDRCAEGKKGRWKTDRSVRRNTKGFQSVRGR